MVIATRVLTLQHSGADVPIPIRVFAPEQGYGFPVPASIRDLLEGDDKKYF